MNSETLHLLTQTPGYEPPNHGEAGISSSFERSRQRERRTVGERRSASSTVAHRVKQLEEIAEEGRLQEAAKPRELDGVALWMLVSDLLAAAPSSIGSSTASEAASGFGRCFRSRADARET